MESSHRKPLGSTAQNLLLISLVAALCLRLFTDVLVLPDDPTSLLVFQLNPFINSADLHPIQTQGVWILLQEENGIPGQSIYEYVTHSVTLTVLGLSNASIWARAIAHKIQEGKSKNSTSA